MRKPMHIEKVDPSLNLIHVAPFCTCRFCWLVRSTYLSKSSGLASNSHCKPNSDEGLAPESGWHNSSPSLVASPPNLAAIDPTLPLRSSAQTSPDQSREAVADGQISGSWYWSGYRKDGNFPVQPGASEHDPKLAANISPPLEWPRRKSCRHFY